MTSNFDNYIRSGYDDFADTFEIFLIKSKIPYTKQVQNKFTVMAKYTLYKLTHNLWLSSCLYHFRKPVDKS